jgi:ABC-type Fe3+/spermidine/putrescine transport system ATPase subunit
MPSIQMTNVIKRFKDILALNRVSLNVHNGEYVCILGPTGSGKTTLLRIIAGLISPDGGRLMIDEKPVDTIAPEDRDVAYVPQQYALFPHLTVLQNVAFSPLARGRTESAAFETARKVLQMVKLDQRENAFPNELSGGMQQRVALARGIASGSNLLLLDEPLGALDARLRMELRIELRRMMKRLNLTVIHVTHDQEEAMTIADTIVVLKDGTVQQIGSPFHIYQNPASIFVANFVGGSNFLPAIVVKTERFYSIVELNEGIRIRVADRSYHRGEPVIVTMRKEATKLTSHVDAKENSIPARVKSLSFLGAFIEYSLVLDNRETVKSKVPSALVANNHLPFQVDDRVYVILNPEDCRLFSPPPIGLASELEAF